MKEQINNFINKLQEKVHQKLTYKILKRKGFVVLEEFRKFTHGKRLNDSQVEFIMFRKTFVLEAVIFPDSRFLSFQTYEVEHGLHRTLTSTPTDLRLTLTGELKHGSVTMPIECFNEECACILRDYLNNKK